MVILQKIAWGQQKIQSALHCRYNFSCYTWLHFPKFISNHNKTDRSYNSDNFGNFLKIEIVDSLG